MPFIEALYSQTHACFLLICKARHHASVHWQKQDVPSLFNSPNYEKQGNRGGVGGGGGCGLCNCLWPPVPDVVKWHLCWGQLIAQFHTWIHCAAIKHDALERHCDIHRRAHMVQRQLKHSKINRPCPVVTRLRGQKYWKVLHGNNCGPHWFLT